jgi:hypothetical protein
MQALGLLNPLAILQDDGHAVGESLFLFLFFIKFYVRTT